MQGVFTMLEISCSSAVQKVLRETLHALSPEKAAKPFSRRKTLGWSGSFRGWSRLLSVRVAQAKESTLTSCMLKGHHRLQILAHSFGGISEKKACADPIQQRDSIRVLSWLMSPHDGF